MSRIGKLHIQVPEGVEINISDDNMVSVKGKLGELQQQLNKAMTMKLENGKLTIDRPSDSKEHKSLHGLSRSLINNMVIGVTEGYTTEQELVGVGYKAIAQGQVLELALGYSHSIFLELPAEVKIKTVTESTPAYMRKTRTKKEIKAAVKDIPRKRVGRSFREN